MSVGERIHNLRIEKRLTLVTLGKKIGMTNGALSQIEHGKANPSERTLKLVAHEFGVNEHWLRTGEGEQYTHKTAEAEIKATADEFLRGEAPEMRLRLVKALDGLSDTQLWLVEAKLWEILTGEILTPEKMKELIQKHDEAKAVSASEPKESVYCLPQDMTPNEMHAELDRQLAEEKGRADASGGSDFGSSETAAG